MSDHGEMVGVNERDHERDDGIAAVVLGVGEDDELGGAERDLCGGLAGGGRPRVAGERSELERRHGKITPAHRPPLPLQLSPSTSHVPIEMTQHISKTPFTLPLPVHTALTNLPGDIMVQPREHHAALCEPRRIRLALLDHHLRDVLGDRRRELPLGDLGIAFSGGAGRGPEGVDLEVRVGGEELDEAAGVSSAAASRRWVGCGAETATAHRRVERTYRWPTVPSGISVRVEKQRAGTYQSRRGCRP